MNTNQIKPRIVVKPPGPKTRELLKRTGDPIEPYPPIWGIPAVKAEGPWVEDVDGNIFLDFVSGKCVVNLGHRHPEIVAALKTQIDQVILGATANRFALTEKLTRLTPGTFEKTVFFGSAGSDSIDGALKLARWTSKRPHILCIAGAYHGQTYGALSVSSTWSWMVRGFYPLAGIFRMPEPYCYRCPFKLDYPECGIQCLTYVEERMFTSYCPPDEVASVIVEPVFGDMGWVIPPDDYFLKLKELCDAHDILFIADEVQTGFGRTGKWFAMDHIGIEPDMVCLGKPIASGVPLSAMVARLDLTLPKVRGGVEHFHQSFTIEANALGCAAALATIRVIEQQKLLENCTKLGAYLMKRLEELKDSSEIIGEVRGRGLLCTIEIVRDRKTKDPAPKESRKICKYALENGLYTMFMGAFSATSIRIAPPLNSTQEIIDLGIDIIEKAVVQTEHEM